MKKCIKCKHFLADWDEGIGTFGECTKDDNSLVYLDHECHMIKRREGDLEGAGGRENCGVVKTASDGRYTRGR